MTKREHEIIVAVLAATDGLQDPLKIVQAGMRALWEMGCDAWGSVRPYEPGYGCHVWTSDPYVNIDWYSFRDEPVITVGSDK